jgi:hypothetical protein
MITTRKQLKALRGEFRKWLRNWRMDTAFGVRVPTGPAPGGALIETPLTPAEVLMIAAKPGAGQIQLRAETRERLNLQRMRNNRKRAVAYAISQTPAAIGLPRN